MPAKPCSTLNKGMSLLSMLQPTSYLLNTLAGTTLGGNSARTFMFTCAFMPKQKTATWTIPAELNASNSKCDATGSIEVENSLLAFSLIHHSPALLHAMLYILFIFTYFASLY